MISPEIDSIVCCIAIFLPVLLLPAFTVSGCRRIALYLAPWSGLPAIALAIWAPSGLSVDIAWLFLGARLGLDYTGQIFLLFTAVLWTIAGIYAQGYFKQNKGIYRFFIYYLSAMTGNLGLIMAEDIVSFYLFFALMSFASYGLVVFDGTVQARRAGRVYLILVVIGEVLLVSSLFLIAESIDSLDIKKIASGIADIPERELIIALVLAGFGIKVGALPLHVWLPLAHPVAPTPASAVLSGAMIKAGLIGWLRFLPIGDVYLPFWGKLCIAMGLIAAFYGVLIGLTQVNPKTVLAYSSISQMGFMTVGIGIGMLAPSTWPIALIAVLLYALHHALAKGALFLSVGIAKDMGSAGWQRAILLTGAMLAALALAGAPLTSGAVAKTALKSTIIDIPVPWLFLLKSLLSSAAVGTSVLMGRFLYLLNSSTKKRKTGISFALFLPWIFLIVCVLFLTWVIAPKTQIDETGLFSSSALWPVVLGTILTWIFWKWKNRLKFAWQCPPGDLLELFIRLAAKSRAPEFHNYFLKGMAGVINATKKTRYALKVNFKNSFFSKVADLAERFQLWPVAGLCFTAIIVVLFILLFPV